MELREQFWQEGRNLSLSAWKSGYKDRLLAEIATEKAPDDSIVIDELVETLQSVTPIYRFDKKSNRTVANKEMRQLIEGLRQKQFEQIKIEIANGRKSTFSDCVCGADLLYLVQDMFPNNQHSKEVLQYLKTICKENAWSKFLDTLQTVEPIIEKQGCGYGFNIYVPKNFKFPDENGYGKRLSSFSGPTKRDVALLSQLEKNQSY